MRVIVLHDSIASSADPDQLDTLVEVEAVTAALRKRGHQIESLAVTLDLQHLSDRLSVARPDLVFNLVETLNNTGRLCHLVPAVLDQLGIPYTGAGSSTILDTTSKLITKHRLRSLGIATPDWYTPGSRSVEDFQPGLYILKPVWEDASVGLEEDSVVEANSIADLLEAGHRRESGLGRVWFAEQFIPGREFNIAVWGSFIEPQLLPVAEIIFSNWEPGKHKVLGYRSKWDLDSFEYKNTTRTFDFAPVDNSLITDLQEISRKCWRLFEFRGYGRVDLRVTEDGQPYVLEINANPCIAPNAGFTAACAQAGISYRNMLERICQYAQVE